MCEFDRLNYCPKCDKKTIHTFGGSGKEGICSECGTTNKKYKEV